MSIFHKDAVDGNKGPAWPNPQGPFPEVTVKGAELAGNGNLTADKVVADAVPAAQNLVAEVGTPNTSEADASTVPELPALTEVPSLGPEPMTTPTTTPSAGEVAPVTAASDDLSLPTNPTSELDSTAVSAVVDVPAPNAATPGPQEVAPATTTTPPTGSFQG